jgi:hypothetical protein
VRLQSDGSLKTKHFSPGLPTNGRMFAFRLGSQDFLRTQINQYNPHTRHEYAWLMSQIGITK